MSKISNLGNSGQIWSILVNWHALYYLFLDDDDDDDNDSGDDEDGVIGGAGYNQSVASFLSASFKPKTRMLKVLWSSSL